MRCTFSEYLFERLCSERGIPWNRIPVAETPTPDYELFPSNAPLVVEVKEIEPNPEERESDRVMAERGWGNVLSHTPGGRVRAKIAACSAQIKARAQGRHPSLLVVCDEARPLGHVEPYNIRVAMYGLEQVNIAVPPPGHGSPYGTGMSYGPKRKMTPEANTSISAIGALFMTSHSDIHLYVYHNKFAKVSLRHELLAQYGIPQFELGEPAPGRTAEWQEIVLAPQP